MQFLIYEKEKKIVSSFFLLKPTHEIFIGIFKYSSTHLDFDQKFHT